MAELQPTDLFLVNRSNVTSTVTTENLMAEILDDDLMIVNRSNAVATITGADVKASLGAQPIDPSPGDITANPDFQGGTGTIADPYILETQICAPAGSSITSTEELTIAVSGAIPGQPVRWIVSNARFTQPDGLTGTGGIWTGRLIYNDTPATSVDQTYIGNLQIGATYFRWSVEQQVSASSPPVVNNVSLVESSPAEGARFTSQSFVASSQVTDGLPIATKTFDAHVDGTLTKTVKFDEPLESTTDKGTGSFFGYCFGTVDQPSGISSILFVPDSVTGEEFLLVGDIITGDNEGNSVQINSIGSINSEGYLSFEYINPVGPTAGSQNYSNPPRSVIDLNFAAGTNMEALASGDAVSQTPQASGTVSSVNGTVVTLSSSSGTWTNGEDVVGPQKTITEANTRLYCAFDSNGNITDLQNDPQDPPYTTQDSNPGLTFTFPATFPSGQTPDEELPDGTTFTVEVTAENIAGTSGPISATVQPEPIEPDIQLAGLTTLYTGIGTQQNIITGVDLAGGGLIWIKCRSAVYNHALNDSSSGFVDILESNTSNPANSNSPLTVLSNGFVSRGVGFDGQGTQEYVAWTFAAAAGYFALVKYTGTGSPQNISHSLATKPGMILVKNLVSADGWRVYHFSQGATKYGILNDTASFQGPTNAYWDDTEPTDSVFTVGYEDAVNTNNSEYIAYLFAEDTPDVIKCGVMKSGNAVTETTGFEPQWILFKLADSYPQGGVDWYIWDSKRDEVLSPNNTDIENDAWLVTTSATGFTLNTVNIGANFDVIYVAIAAPPDTRSQTNEEFVETQLKMMSYKNRKEVVCGQRAAAERDELITALVEQGYTDAQIADQLGE